MKHVALLVLVSLSAAAAEAPPQATRVVSAIVFKNGLAFITREGPVPFTAGQATISPVPDAALGTLWIGAAGRTIDGVHASSESYETTRTAASISDLIDANPGRVAMLRVNDREYNGTLMVPAATPAATEGAERGPVSIQPAPLVLLNVDGRVHAFPRSAVQLIAFAQPPVTTVPVASSRTMLTLRSKGTDATVPVTISYLRGGVSWMPEYSIELLDRERARLTMQATLIDDEEELRDTNVRFAVGYPNFEFASVDSPLIPTQSLAALLDSLSGRRHAGDNVMSNVMTQNILVNSATAGGSRSIPAVPETGEGSEDLFFYDRAGVTMKAGERASYPILAATVPYKHLYQWDVAAETESSREEVAGGQAGQVWHSVALTNSGTTPWTTGPALVTANGKPLAQDTLSYTAAGATGTVKLTLATDVAVWREEAEVSRKPRALTRRGSGYDELTIEGTLQVHNYKREAITLSVRKTVEGETLTSAPAAKVTKRAISPRAVNPTEKLQWDVPLAAGEAKTVRYSYKVYVRE